MSLQNLLNPSTQKEEWSKIYVNELNAEKITSPEHSSTLVYVRSDTLGAPASAVGDYPIYQEPDTINTVSGGSAENFEVLSKGFKVLKSGWYNVYIRSSLILANVDATASIAPLRNGSPVSSILIAQTCPVHSASSLVHVNLCDLLFLSANDILTLGVSSEDVAQTCQWVGWGISASTISLQDTP